MNEATKNEAFFTPYTHNFKEKHLMKNTTVRPVEHPHKSDGFTMIELMIVVAIIGIISAIGYPSYTEYVKKARRSDGHLALMSAVQSMERCKTTRFSYVNCTLPSASSEENYYSLALAEGVTASSFSIVATPQNSQATDTDCATLTINALGERTPAACW